MMKQLLTTTLFVMTSLMLGACHCKMCAVGLPGDACTPCPKPPKPLKCPPKKPRCELPCWPERPVKCVTTKIIRKCCHFEEACTDQGYKYKIEVCEITYQGLYSDGSSKIWTEVSRNPVKNGPTRVNSFKNKTEGKLNSKPPIRGSLVGDRCEGNCVQEKIQNLDTTIEQGVFKLMKSH